MGLLRKAASTVAHEITGELRAQPDTEPAPGSGLLKKSVSARQEPAEVTEELSLSVELVPEPLEELAIAEREDEHVPAALPPQKPPSGQVVSDILQRINSLNDGVELPSGLFSVLAATLGIRKGALLLYDALRFVYAPWASVGYDQTSMHRMRIPLGANDSFNALANGSPLLLAETRDLAAYQQYFSSREFSSLGRLYLAPFIAEEKLIAVLLITEIASPLEDDAALLDCLGRVVAAGSPRVHAARTEKLAATVPTGSGAAAGDETTRFISSIGTYKGSLLLLTISVEAWAASVIAAHEHLDPFRLFEDITYFLGTFLADVGKVMVVRNGVFIVALSDFDAEEKGLFLHQLSSFLRGLFGGADKNETGAAPQILHSRSWPADGGDMRGIIESLSS
jgi:hypothetical protein